MQGQALQQCCLAARHVRKQCFFQSTKQEKRKMLLTPVPSHYPILSPHPSQAIQGATVSLTLTEVTQIWGTQKHFLNTISQLVLLTCTVAGEYLPDTLYSTVKLTSYCKNLHERVGLAVGWLCKLKQREAGPPQYCPAAFAPLPVHTRLLPFHVMMSYPIHIIVNSVIELWESNTRQANYLFLWDEMKTKRPDMHLEALLVQHMLFV